MKKFLLSLVILATGSAASASTQVELFSEAGLWGDRLVRIVDPAAKEAYYLIRNSTLQDENLGGRVSSVRLDCGERSGRIYLSDTDNSTTKLHEWKGNTIFFTCDAGQTLEVNLHQKKAYPSLAMIGDKVKSVLIVTDAPETDDSSIITLFSEAGLWGKRYRIIRSTDNNITPAELYGMDLLYSLSSVRIECGKYQELLDLYSQTTGGSVERILTCRPYETREYNLHSLWGTSGFYLGDAIRRANIRTVQQ